jgi:hypothetical protein
VHAIKGEFMFWFRKKNKRNTEADKYIAVCSVCSGAEFWLYVRKPKRNSWSDVLGTRCMQCGSKDFKNAC